jgi:hypothetical protein
MSAPLRAALAILALSTALGALVVGELVVVPMLGRTDLLDANLATAVSAPVHLRTAEIGVAAGLAVALAVPAWLRSRFATSVALLLLLGATARRVVLLPALYAAWARVDIVAGRPEARLHEARELARWSEALTFSSVLLIGVLVALVALAWRRVPVTPAEPHAPAGAAIGDAITAA